jgi:dihydrofolate reductase
MIVSIIVAMDENRGIGYQNRLPWDLPDDLKRFKRLTMGHSIIMGRKTFESIGKPLPGRTNIVVTRNPQYQPHGCRVAHSFKEALTISQDIEDEEVFIIGGAGLFRQALDIADRIYLTQIHAQVQADVFFPQYDQSNWQEITSSFRPADDANQFGSTFQQLVRIAKTQSD